MQAFTVTGLIAGQHNTKLHGTITGVIYEIHPWCLGVAKVGIFVV